MKDLVKKTQFEDTVKFPILNGMIQNIKHFQQRLKEPEHLDFIKEIEDRLLLLKNSKLVPVRFLLWLEIAAIAIMGTKKNHTPEP